MKVTAQTVDALKVMKAYFAAGALAYSLGHDPAYGCHFGMRSTREKATKQFMDGYYAAMNADKG